MSHSPKILKFLSAIRDLRTSATRSRVAYVVWGGRRGIVAWNSLFNDPEMSGFVTTVRHQKRGRKGKMRRGRPSMRYALTRAGRKRLRALLAADQAIKNATLKAAHDAKEAAQRTRQDEIERKAQEKLQAAINARPRYPSKGRKRSAKDIADRLAWRRRTYLNEQVESARVGAPAVSMPASPVLMTSRPTPVAAMASLEDDWRRYVSIPTRPAGFESPQMAAAPDKNTAALLSKIQRAGYQTRDGKVLFGGNQWLTPQEWQRRMPGILD